MQDDQTSPPPTLHYAKNPGRQSEWIPIFGGVQVVLLGLEVWMFLAFAGAVGMNPYGGILLLLVSCGGALCGIPVSLLIPPRSGRWIGGIFAGLHALYLLGLIASFASATRHSPSHFGP